MRCFVHEEAEAVALCVHCGKALCPECTGSSAAGAQVCSTACAASREARPFRIQGPFLHCLGAVLASAAFFYLMEGLWQISLFLALAAFLSFRAGLRSGRKILGLTEMYYRTGDAMEKVHRFRHCLEEFLDGQAKLTGNALTLAQLNAVDTARKAELLEQAFQDVRQKMAKCFSASEFRSDAKNCARDLQFCQLLAETYFEQHAKDLQSIPGSGRMLREIFDAHMSLRSRIGWLSEVNRQLAACRKGTEPQ